MIQTILVAVDDSRAAFRAAAVAVDLASALGARIVVVSVVDGVLAETRVPGLPADGRAQAEAMRAAQNHVRTVADRAGVEVDLCLAHGHVADTLLDHVRSSGAGLIVIGRVDRPGVRLTHVGRTAEQVLEFSDVPVLVVPAARR